MALAYTRVSNAAVEDIVFYDPAADRRAASMDVGWDKYLEVAAQEVMTQLEFGWYPTYCSTTGASLYTKNASGKMVSGFDPSKLDKANQTLIRLETFKTIEVFYQSLVTDTSNVNEVDKANYDHAKERYSTEYAKAIQVMTFYDLDGDGTVTKLEEGYQADVDYLNGNRRHF